MVVFIAVFIEFGPKRAAGLEVIPPPMSMSRVSRLDIIIWILYFSKNQSVVGTFWNRKGCVLLALLDLCFPNLQLQNGDDAQFCSGFFQSKRIRDASRFRKFESWLSVSISKKIEFSEVVK